MTQRLLVADDDPMLLALYRVALRNLSGVEIDFAPSEEEARILLSTNEYSLVLLDLNLSPAHSLEGLRLLDEIVRDRSSSVVMMSTDQDEATVTECVRRGATCFFPKSMGFAVRLSALVREALAA